MRIRPVEDYDPLDPRGPMYCDALTGKPIWGQAEIDALLNDPATIDCIVCEETSRLIVQTFEVIARAYFEPWARTDRPCVEFTNRLPAIRRMAVRRCRAKWGRRRDQRGQSWFDEVPLRPANTELAAAQEVWRRKARAEEIKRLGKAETSPVTSPIAEPPAKPTAAIPAQASSATPSPTPAASIANEQRPATETLAPSAGINNKAEPTAPPVTKADSSSDAAPHKRPGR
ncbi:MAG TPA: hypothetical protein VKB78_00920, partial [Pirellulales bacterium]|nr:hypothetical protein [Pirellulales bacterium]